MAGGQFETETSKLKEFADDNFRFDENGRKLSKPVENTVGKGEIARDEQFLFFPQCFRKSCFPGASKGVTVWEWANEIKVLTQVSLCRHRRITGVNTFSDVLNAHFQKGIFFM